MTDEQLTPETPRDEAILALVAQLRPILAANRDIVDDAFSIASRLEESLVAQQEAARHAKFMEGIAVKNAAIEERRLKRPSPAASPESSPAAP